MLRDAVEAIRRQREQAWRAGYDEYRLVVVNPPRERTIAAAGLEGALHRYVADHAAQELAALSAQALLERVSGCRHYVD